LETPIKAPETIKPSNYQTLQPSSANVPGKKPGGFSRMGQFLVIQQVIDKFSLAPGKYQIGLPEDAQVLGSDRLLDAERVVDFLYASRVFIVNDAADAYPQRMRQCAEYLGRRFQLFLRVNAGGDKMFAHTQSDDTKIGFVVFAGKDAISISCHLSRQIKNAAHRPAKRDNVQHLIESNIC
jgi:hypothetical protein